MLARGLCFLSPCWVSHDDKGVVISVRADDANVHVDPPILMALSATSQLIHLDDTTKAVALIAPVLIRNNCGQSIFVREARRAHILAINHGNNNGLIFQGSDNGRRFLQFGSAIGTVWSHPINIDRCERDVVNMIGLDGDVLSLVLQCKTVGAQRICELHPILIFSHSLPFDIEVAYQTVEREIRAISDKELVPDSDTQLLMTEAPASAPPVHRQTSNAKEIHFPISHDSPVSLMHQPQHPFNMKLKILANVDKSVSEDSPWSTDVAIMLNDSMILNVPRNSPDGSTVSQTVNFLPHQTFFSALLLLCLFLLNYEYYFFFFEISS
jgi:hypothetical protein